MGEAGIPNLSAPLKSWPTASKALGEENKCMSSFLRKAGQTAVPAPERLLQQGGQMQLLFEVDSASLTHPGRSVQVSVQGINSKTSTSLCW